MRRLGTYVTAFAAIFAAPACAAPLALPQEPGYVGPAYWSQFDAAKGKWDKPGFFPIGVWFEGVYNSGDTSMDKAAGINTYIALTAPSSMAEVRAAGMYAIQQWEITQHTLKGIHPGTGAETVGWLVGDEIDMRLGPGSAGWDGTDADGHCLPPTAKCGYTAARTLKESFPGGGRFYFQNFGKGVLVWESNEQASGFVNGGSQDTLGADIYWYTDKEACHWSQGGKYALEGIARATGAGPSGAGSSPPSMHAHECARASNYGANIKRLRQLDALDGKYQPLWCVPNATDKPREVQAAVMSCLIAGASGIMYFNHNFGGICPTQHALRDRCYSAQRAAVTAMNALVRELAPVLNSPRLAYDWGQPDLDIRLSQAPDGATAYVFVAQRVGDSGDYSLNLPAALASATSAQATCNGTGNFVKSTVVISGGKLPVSFAKESDWCVFAIGS